MPPPTVMLMIAAARPNVIELQEYLLGTSAPPNQEDRLSLREVARQVQRLPEEQKQVLLLIGLEGFSYEEAANITGVPVGTVMSRLSRVSLPDGSARLDASRALRRSSADWYRRFGEPDFAYGRALAEVHAVALTRMANAEVLPLEFTNFADTISVLLR